MPSGFQNNFRWGDQIRSYGVNNSGIPWNFFGAPLIGYDAVYTYRSGKKSKLLSQKGAYQSLVRSGSLSDQMRKRVDFLNQQMKEAFEPTTGSTSVFSKTDTGHPFATYRFTASQPYATMSKVSGTASRWTAVVSPQLVLPYPNLADPFGTGIVSGGFDRRFTYFTWPSGYLSAAAPILSNQVVTNSLKNGVASGLIASSNPWAPKASLATSALELLMLDIPTFTKNLERYMFDIQSLKKTASNDWLNAWFGWVPLMRDIRATIEALMKLHMLLYSYDEASRRKRAGDLGKWSRIDTTPLTSGPMKFGSPLTGTYVAPYFKVGEGSTDPGLAPAGIPSGVGTWSRSVEVTADYRFAARFHRGATPNGKERDFLEKALELLGLEVTPAVLWELAPWTWLLDWGSNLGSVAANLSQLDWSNVLLDYAYLTFCVKTQGQSSWTGPLNLGDGRRMSHTYVATSFSSRELVREQASPYGFSVSWEGLNPFQLSILAALGMSRGR